MKSGFALSFGGLNAFLNVVNHDPCAFSTRFEVNSARGFHAITHIIKTEGLESGSQPLLYAAALSPRAILENVFVERETGKVDFFNTILTSNGRAMVKRKDIAFTDNQVDLGKVDFIVFITKMHDILPPVVRLSPECAAAGFMLGESVETSAGDPAEAGKSLRVVGTSPFIIGSQAEDGNMFLHILRENPDIQYFILNTGNAGE